MTKLTSAGIAVALLVGVVFALPAAPVYAEDDTTRDQTAPTEEKAEPSRDHGWLKQLVGEWEVHLKSYVLPDQPPVESTGTDTVRAVGVHWIVAEMNFKMMGTSLTGLMSLGYDPQKEQFAGTWIDSFSGYLWVYKGTLNAAGDTMTLTTEGPSMQNLNETARYKEVITIKSDDVRTFKSTMETKDGEWITILEAAYKRKE